MFQCIASYITPGGQKNRCRNAYVCNSCKKRVGNQQEKTRSMNIIATRTEAPDGIADTGYDSYLDAVIVAGVFLWGDFQDGAALPPSLFAQEKPPWLDTWPLFGP
jgi:hypothetical protein